MKNEFDFKETKRELESIKETEDKIRYLINIRTEFLQSDILWDMQIVSFDKKCDFEINKLYDLLELENRLERILKIKTFN